MNDFATTLLRWTIRISLMLVGMVFFLCLLAVACVLAMAWGLRALWAKLTGQPVMPWAMRMSPRQGWSTVHRSTARWTTPRPAARAGQGSTDVTDVVAREIR